MKARHILAAMLALASPFSAGVPPLDTGRRELRLGPRVTVSGEPPRSTWREPEVDRDAVPERVQAEARDERRKRQRAAEKGRRAHALLSSMSPAQKREVVRLHKRGTGERDIARMVGVSVASVRAQIESARVSQMLEAAE